MQHGLLEFAKIDCGWNSQNFYKGDCPCCPYGSCCTELTTCLYLGVPIMSSDTPYTRMSDEETPTFNTDTERSKWLSIADSSIEHDQERLRKLKFLVTPLFQNVGRLKDAKSVVDIHRALYMDPEYDGDEKRAASDLYVLLGIVGMEKFKNCSTSDSEAEVTSIRSSDKFKWRVELVHLSDKATKHKRDSKLIDHLFDSYEIKMSRESVTSPIPLYEYLIEKGFFKPGEEKDLEELKNAVTFCKCINDRRQNVV